MNYAESILIKLIAEGHVGAVDRGDPTYEYWPTNGDCDEHLLDHDEWVYLHRLTEAHHP